jgi:Uma2 family endonuclease
MAAGIHVPVEVYLRTSDYEPDAEYVDGEIVERPMGEFNHADWQQAIQRWFAAHSREWNVRAISEIRVQVKANHYLVPDVTVLDRSLPVEQIVTHPPLAVFEVLSPEDRFMRLRQKLAEYAEMGIPQIWIVNPGHTPESTTFERYRNGSLAFASRFEQAGMDFDLAEIAAYLQG